MEYNYRHRMATEADEKSILELLQVYFQEQEALIYLQKNFIPADFVKKENKIFKTPSLQNNNSSPGSKFKKSPEKIILRKLPISNQGKKYRYYITELKKKIAAATLVIFKEKIFFKNYHYALIDFAITDPKFRKKGIMTSLLRFIAKSLKKEKIHCLEANVLANNDPAMNFWKKRGFALNSYNLFSHIDKILD